MSVFAKFQLSSMSKSSQKFCGVDGWVGGWWWVVCKPILVFSKASLSQAEQYGQHKVPGGWVVGGPESFSYQTQLLS